MSSYVLGTSVSPGNPDEQIDTPFWGRQTCVDLRSDTSVGESGNKLSKESDIKPHRIILSRDR